MQGFRGALIVTLLIATAVATSACRREVPEPNGFVAPSDISKPVTQ